MIDDLKKHTEDLIPELRKWADQPLASFDIFLSPLVKQHIKTGCIELWNILEGEDGIRMMTSQYDVLNNDIPEQIETSIKNQVLRELPKFEIENLNWFVEDIKDFLEKKLFENRLYAFKVATDTSITPHRYFIRSETPEGSDFRNPYLTGTKDNLEKLVGIMKKILNDAQLQQMIKTLHNLGHKLYERRVSFSEKISLIINNIVHAVSDEDRILLGNCERCEHIKKKLKVN